MPAKKQKICYSGRANVIKNRLPASLVYSDGRKRFQGLKLRKQEHVYTQLSTKHRRLSKGMP